MGDYRDHRASQKEAQRVGEHQGCQQGDQRRSLHHPAGVPNGGVDLLQGGGHSKDDGLSVEVGHHRAVEKWATHSEAHPFREGGLSQPGAHDLRPGAVILHLRYPTRGNLGILYDPPVLGDQGHPISGTLRDFPDHGVEVGIAAGPDDLLDEPHLPHQLLLVDGCQVRPESGPDGRQRHQHEDRDERREAEKQSVMNA